MTNATMSATTDAELEAARAERGLPSVNDARPRRHPYLLYAAVGLLVLGLGIGVTYWGALHLRERLSAMAKPRPREEQPAPRKKTFTTEVAPPVANATGPAPARSPTPMAPIPILPAAPSAELRVPALVRTDAGAAPMPLQTGSNKAPFSTALGPGQMGATSVAPSPYDSAFVVNGGAQPGSSSPLAMAGSDRPASPGAQPAGFANVAGESGKGALAGLLTPTATPRVRAGTIGDRNFLVTKGTLIDCVLTTKIVAMLPGMVKCKLTRDLYSANGRVVLAERGSEVTGEQSGAMKQGQTRLYILWSRIVTPQGATIQIDSPGTDALGAAGIDGDVDNHWTQRIGGALLLSVVQDAFAYEIARQQNQSGNQTVPATAAYQQTTQTGEKLAEKVLESTIHIPPTLYKHQGERIGIFIARDLDFSAIYELQPQ